MILAVGLTVLVSMFAGWNSLAGQIEGLRIAMHEGDARLRQERREDVAALRGEMGELRRELYGEMGELCAEVRAMGQKIDRLAESLIYVMAEMKRRRETPDPGSGVPESHAPKGESP